MSERKRRWWWWLVIAALAVLAFLFLRCAGIGFGGPGDGADDRQTPQTLSATNPEAGAARCQVRIDADGLSLAGARAEIAAVIDKCAAGIDLAVTGNARFGDVEAFRKAAAAARIDLLDRPR